MRRDWAFWIAVAVSGVVATVGCLPLFDKGNENLIVLAFPGVFVASMTTNIHDPNPVVAIVFAWIFWVLVFVFARKAWRKARAR